MATANSKLKKARLDLKLPSATKDKLEKAAAVLGKTLTEYVIRVVEEDAIQVIARHESMKLKNDIFDSFINDCIKAESPNEALLEAGIFTKAKGIK